MVLIKPRASAERLNTCEPILKEIMLEVAEETDIVVLEGQRSLDKQKDLFATGKSRTLKSKHVLEPSQAVDIAPWPIDWNNVNRFRELAAVVIRVAESKGVALRWGGNFKGFFDGPHYELKE